MSRSQVRRALTAHGFYCDWCGIQLSVRNARVVERPAGPLPFCGTCLRRYERPDLHPYLHKALAHLGR